MPAARAPDLARLILAACLVLAVAGCASSSKPRDDGAVGRAVSKTQSGVGDAALTPLNDLNLRRVPIPPRLEAIQSPYEAIKRRDCIGIAAEVNELTAILGPDSDAPEEPDDTLSEKTGDEAAHLALNEVKDAVTGFIPYRSLVRMASGASEHERRLRAAYERGVQRRAYLKGVGLALGCTPPAAPDPKGVIAPEGPPIVYRGADPSSD
ncbi:MAG: hypothetical protein GC155_04510 [Alphaproteobacteria bacterium]|nr:hypothetical protein [Alphaproteobacteria bacterium]